MLTLIFMMSIELVFTCSQSLLLNAKMFCAVSPSSFAFPFIPTKTLINPMAALALDTTGHRGNVLAIFSGNNLFNVLQTPATTWDLISILFYVLAIEEIFVLITCI